jgi:hypothetical protein
MTLVIERGDGRAAMSAKLWVAILLGVALAVAIGGSQAVASDPTGFATTNNCIEHQAFLDGDDTAVARRLPTRYMAVRDPSSGRPLLFARAIRCQSITVDGHTAPATMASFGVVVDSPDGQGCASAAPVLGSVKGDAPPACNWYTLTWLADDQKVVDWLRAGTPEFPAEHVSNLMLTDGTFDPARGGAPFHFEAPPPAPSPFTMDDTYRERSAQQLSVRGGYWNDTPQGTVKISISTDDLTSGDATGVVRASPGSELATLMGASERPYVPGYSLIAAERWGQLTYRKQLLGPVF